MLAERIDYIPSHTVPSADGRYLFVMLSPDEPWRIERYVAWVREGWARAGEEMEDRADAERHLMARVREEMRLRRKYPASGLYRNDGSTRPLWTVEWYEGGPDSIRVASDGVHLVRHPTLANDAYDMGVTFYARGRPLRSYKVSELLLENDKMGYTSAYAYRWWENNELNDDAGTFTIMKLNDSRVVFNFATGEVVE